jgi:hypothetical protein
MRQSFKNILRPPLAKLATSHRPGPLADVAVLSSPRSGSTWLMEIIAGQPGMKFINEPDHKGLLERYHALRVTPRWCWLSLSPAERQDVADYLVDDRRTGLFGPVNPFVANHSWHTSRRVLKLIRMTALVEWIDSLGIESVYVLRHPIPQARSCMTRRHSLRFDEFLADSDFLHGLNPDALSYVRKVACDGDPMLQFVTQWCLENIVALDSPLAGDRFAVTTHELLLTDPVAELERLAQVLSLDRVDLLLERVSRPSRTTDTSSAATRESIRAGQATDLLSSWRRDISASEERRLLEPLRAFEIDLYTCGEVMPTPNPRWVTTSESLNRPRFPATSGGNLPRNRATVTDLS